MANQFLRWLNQQTFSRPLVEAVSTLYTGIRPATESELRRLVPLASKTEHQLYRKDYESNLQAIQKEDSDFVADILDGSAYAYTKTGDDLVVFAPRNDGFFIYDLFVGESSRNQGIGSELLQFVLDRASKLPVRLAVAKGNIGAQRLYSKNGFVIDGETADQYRMVTSNRS